MGVRAGAPPGPPVGGDPRPLRRGPVFEARGQRGSGAGSPAGQTLGMAAEAPCPIPPRRAFLLKTMAAAGAAQPLLLPLHTHALSLPSSQRGGTGGAGDLKVLTEAKTNNKSA